MIQLIELKPYRAAHFSEESSLLNGWKCTLVHLLPVQRMFESALYRLNMQEIKLKNSNIYLSGNLFCFHTCKDREFVTVDEILKLKRF